MTDKQRYERAMRHDYPQDFIPDDEWDFIEAMASCKGDGVKNKKVTTTASRMPKSGGVKNMAKQNKSDRTVQDKCRYYENRVNDKRLTDGQRRWAQRRLNELCAGGKSKPAVSAPGGSGNSQKYTDGQKYAFGAGVGYAAGKAGKRVEVKPENRQSFRDGVARGKKIRK